MQIRVLFFGILKEKVGKGSDSLSLLDVPTVADVLAHYADTNSDLRPYFGSIAVSVNQEYADARTLLKEGDEVALLPPVSGGSTIHGPSTGQRDKKSDQLSTGIRVEN